MSNNSRHVPQVETGLRHRQYPLGLGRNSPDWDERRVGYALPESQAGLGPEAYLVSVMRRDDEFYIGVEWPDTPIHSNNLEYVDAEKLVPKQEAEDWNDLVKYLDDDENLEVVAEKYVMEHGQHLSKRRLKQAATETRLIANRLEEEDEDLEFGF